MKPGKCSANRGRWTDTEHLLFLKAIQKHGKKWELVSQMLKTRSVVQVRTHAQKYFIKLDKAKNEKLIETHASRLRNKAPMPIVTPESQLNTPAIMPFAAPRAKFYESNCDRIIVRRNVESYGGKNIVTEKRLRESNAATNNNGNRNLAPMPSIATSLAPDAANQVPQHHYFKLVHPGSSLNNCTNQPQTPTAVIDVHDTDTDARPDIESPQAPSGTPIMPFPNMVAWKDTKRMKMTPMNDLNWYNGMGNVGITDVSVNPQQQPQQQHQLPANVFKSASIPTMASNMYPFVMQNELGQIPKLETSETAMHSNLNQAYTCQPLTVPSNYVLPGTVMDATSTPQFASQQESSDANANGAQKYKIVCVMLPTLVKLPI